MTSEHVSYVCIYRISSFCFFVSSSALSFLPSIPLFKWFQCGTFFFSVEKKNKNKTTKQKINESWCLMRKRHTYKLTSFVPNRIGFRTPIENHTNHISNVGWKKSFKAFTLLRQNVCFCARMAFIWFSLTYIVHTIYSHFFSSFSFRFGLLSNDIWLNTNIPFWINYIESKYTFLVCLNNGFARF